MGDMKQCWECVDDVLYGEKRQQMWILIKAEKQCKSDLYLCHAGGRADQVKDREH